MLDSKALRADSGRKRQIGPPSFAVSRSDVRLVFKPTSNMTGIVDGMDYSGSWPTLFAGRLANPSKLIVLRPSAMFTAKEPLPFGGRFLAKNLLWTISTLNRTRAFQQMEEVFSSWWGRCRKFHTMRRRSHPPRDQQLGTCRVVFRDYMKLCWPTFDQPGFAAPRLL